MYWECRQDGLIRNAYVMLMGKPVTKQSLGETRRRRGKNER